MAEAKSSLRDELSSLKIDRRAQASQRRGVPRFVWGVALALVALGGVALWRATLGAPLAVRVAYAERSEAAAPGAAAEASVVLQGSGYVVTGSKYISIGVRVPGRIEAYLVDEAETVKAGQPLVQLEKKDYEASLDRARAALELARAQAQLADTELRRQRVLRSEDVASQSTLDVKDSEARVAHAQVHQAESALVEAQVALDYTTLRAPRDGVVLAKLKEVGEIAVPGGFEGGGDLVRMADLSDLRAELDVNELDLAKVRLGQRADVTPDAFPDKHFAAQVVKLYPQINRQKGTLKVEVRLLERDESLRPDSSVRISFLANAPSAADGAGAPQPVITIPRAALHDGAVWVVSDGRLRSARVSVAGERGDRSVVGSGLLGGEAVVVEADGELAEGKRVEVRAGGADGDAG